MVCLAFLSIGVRLVMPMSGRLGVRLGVSRQAGESLEFPLDVGLFLPCRIVCEVEERFDAVRRTHYLQRSRHQRAPRIQQPPTSRRCL